MSRPTRSELAIQSLRDGEYAVDATPVMLELYSDSVGQLPRELRLREALRDGSSTKHLILSASEEIDLLRLTAFLQFIGGYCTFTALTIANFSLVCPSRSIASGLTLLQLDELTVNNLTVSPHCEDPFAQLLITLAPSCSKLAIRGIHYSDDDDARLLKYIAGEIYSATSITYVPSICQDSLPLATSYTLEDQEAVEERYGRLIRESFPAFAAFLLMCCPSVQTISVYFDLVVLDVPQIRGCLDSFRILLSLATNVEELRITFHGDKASADVPIRCHGGNLLIDGTIERAFAVMGTYSEYGAELMETLEVLRSSLENLDRGAAKEAFFTSLCEKVCNKSASTASEPWSSMRCADLLSEMREEPDHFDSFVHLLREAIDVPAAGFNYSVRTQTKRQRLLATSSMHSSVLGSLTSSANNPVTEAPSSPRKVVSATLTGSQGSMAPLISNPCSIVTSGPISVNDLGSRNPMTPIKRGVEGNYPEHGSMKMVLDRLESLEACTRKQATQLDELHGTIMTLADVIRNSTPETFVSKAKDALASL